MEDLSQSPLVVARYLIVAFKLSLWPGQFNFTEIRLLKHIKKNDDLVGRSLSRVLTAQGPVVQSVVSLTSSLRAILLTVLADSIHNILIFFAEKM